MWNQRMRFLKFVVIGVLGPTLTVPVVHAAAYRCEPRSITQPPASTAALRPPAIMLVSDASGTKRSAASSHSGKSAGAGNSFDEFGHSVASGAKGIGHKVEGGAKNFGHSVTDGWESFKRNFNGGR
jgi:hypothetical protein